MVYHKIAVTMYSSVLFIIASIICFKCSSCLNQVRDAAVHFNFLDPDPLLSTKVKADIEQYRIGLQNEDTRLNVSQLIRKYGYNAEEHQVTTTDGYELTLIRIPSNGHVVFLMHGLLSSSDDWVTAGPHSAIAYLLANEGYDVWMGNARGNKHSRKHVILSASSPEFWDFSWDEIGRYDLPASIDYILTITNQTQLFYVGHSQGATASMVMCSELPEYNNKISLMIEMAAPAAIPNIKNPFLNFLKYVTLLHPEILFSLIKEMGFYEFLPNTDLMQSFGVKVCGVAELAEIVCSNMLFLVCGFNAAQLNVTNLPVIFAHSPAGASTKQIEHFSQSVISGKFRRFDYGEKRNLELYGSREPPEYRVEEISAPVALFYSDNDWLVSVEDSEVLRSRLKNIIEYYKVPLNDFNHIDYLFAKDLKELVFSKMLTLFKRYENNNNVPSSNELQ